VATFLDLPWYGRTNPSTPCFSRRVFAEYASLARSNGPANTILRALLSARWTVSVIEFKPACSTLAARAVASAGDWNVPTWTAKSAAASRNPHRESPRLAITYNRGFLARYRGERPEEMH